MIKRMYVDNYRTFSNFELVPKQVNLVMGSNGSGKSSLFEIVHSLQALIYGQAKVGLCFPPQSLTRWDKRNVQKFEIDSVYEGIEYKYSLTISHDIRRAESVIRDESLLIDGILAYRAGMGQVSLTDGNKSFQFPPDISYLGFLGENSGLDGLYRFTKSMIQGYGYMKVDPNGISSVSSAERPEGISGDGSDFVSWFRSAAQENPEQIAQLFADMQKIMPGFRALKLRSREDDKTQRELIATFNLRSGDRTATYDIGFGELSEGQKMLIVLYTSTAFRLWSERAYIYDEPDNFLALSEVQPYLVAMTDKAHDVGAQVFVISHHPEVIDYMAADNAILFERTDAGPTRVRSLPIDRDMGLKPSELIIRGLIDGP